MFTTAERDRVSARILELAEQDDRIVSAAVVGSLTTDLADEFSDIDLTFGVADGIAIDEVLEDITRAMADEFDAVKLLDLVSRGTVYRVFLLADWLQVDLSFAPAADARQGSDRFRTVFGTFKVDYPPAAEPADLYGWAILYARHARVTIERGKWWQAENMISGLRSSALDLACALRGLPTGYGRGFDLLPADVSGRLASSLVRSLEREELLRALEGAIEGLMHEAGSVGNLAERVEPQLRRLISLA